MNIYTYFVPIGLIEERTQRRVLEWWRQTWSRAGWNPVILSEVIARTHPRFDSYSAVMRKKPLMNSAQYELACFYRWMATAAAGGGVQCDYDCINNGLTPEDIAPLLADGKMTIYEPAHVPSLVSGSAAEFERMCDLFAGFEVSQYKPHMIAESQGGTKVSDMFILANFPEQFRPNKIVWEFHREPGWQTAKAIHFSNWACEGIGKENAIPRWLNGR